MRTAARLGACAVALALGCAVGVAGTSAGTHAGKHARAAKAAKPKPVKPQPGQPKSSAARTWPKTICGQLVPTVRALTGVEVQANIPKQGPANALDCRYTAGGIDGAFLLESKKVDASWLPHSTNSLTRLAAQTCGDAATPAAAPAPVSGLGAGAVGVDFCPGDTFTSKASGQTALYVVNGTAGWWFVASPPFATTSVAKLAALARKLIALYP